MDLLNSFITFIQINKFPNEVLIILAEKFVDVKKDYLLNEVFTQNKYYQRKISSCQQYKCIRKALKYPQYDEFALNILYQKDDKNGSMYLQDRAGYILSKFEKYQVGYVYCHDYHSSINNILRLYYIPRYGRFIK